ITAPDGATVRMPYCPPGPARISVSPSACPSWASATRSADGRKTEPSPETTVTTARKAIAIRWGPQDRGGCMWTSLVRHHSNDETAGRFEPTLALADRPVMDLPGRSAHPRPTVLAMRPHRRPRDRSNPSPLLAPEARCRTSLGAGGGICSRGRPGIPSRASDLVTMNVYPARSDSSPARLLCQVVRCGLGFLPVDGQNSDRADIILCRRG